MLLRSAQQAGALRTKLSRRQPSIALALVCIDYAAWADPHGSVRLRRPRLAPSVPRGRLKEPLRLRDGQAAQERSVSQSVVNSRLPEDSAGVRPRNEPSCGPRGIPGSKTRPSAQRRLRRPPPPPSLRPLCRRRPSLHRRCCRRRRQRPSLR